MTPAIGALRVWRRDAVVYRRLAKFLLVPNFLDPVFFLVAFGLGIGGFVTNVDGMRYIEFLAPGLMASSVMYTASFETTWNVTTKLDWDHTYDAMIATPLEPADIVGGEVLWSATRAAITGTAFLVIAGIVGLFGSWWAVAMPLVAFVLGVAIASMCMLAAAYVTTMSFWGYFFTLVITPMFLLSGIFFPLDRLPGWAQTIAAVLPLSHGTTLMRAFASGDLRPGLLVDAAVLVITPLVLLPLAVCRFGRRVCS